MVAELKDLAPRDADIPFVSTVTGSCLLGSRLGADYWWRNVRQPVQFLSAVREAAKLGARFFIEIGPSSTLLRHILDSLSGEVTGYTALAVLERNNTDGDPFDKAVAKALVLGAQVNGAMVFGRDPGGTIQLPSYPWQQKQYRYASTPEAVGVVESERHPLAGARFDSEALEWHSHIDTALIPDLADHKVGEQIILPGTGFLEIAFSVASQWLKSEHVTIANFEILKPLDLTGGKTREVMTRVSPGSNTIEILSRSRLARSGWILNCRGKMLHGDTQNLGLDLAQSSACEIANKEKLYAIANTSGLHYGPAFQLVESVTADGDRVIRVKLAGPKTPSPYLLDPVRLDCCMQGLITAFPELRAVERGVAYVPVRVDEAALIVPRGIPHSAVIQLLNKSERVIVANCDILTSDGAVMACLRGMRCQALPVRRTDTLDSIGILELLQHVDGRLLGQTGVRASANDILTDAKSMGFLAQESIFENKGAKLLDGWATTVAYEIVWSLAKKGRLDLDLLIESERLPKALEPWLINLLRNLEAAGLAHGENGRWSLIKDPTLPRSATVVKALAKEYPARAAEILLAGEVTGFAARILSAKSIHAISGAELTLASLNFFDVANAIATNANTLLMRLVRQSKKIIPRERSLRILQLGAGPLAQDIASFAAGKSVQLTIIEPNKGRLDCMQTTLPKNCNVITLSAERASELDIYDLIISADGLYRFPPEITLARLQQSLASNGILLAVEPKPSLFRDLVFGIGTSWFESGTADFPVGLLRNAEEWRSALGDAGFKNTRTTTIRCGSDFATLLIGEAPAIRLTHDEKENESLTTSVVRRATLVLNSPGVREKELAAHLGGSLSASGVEASTVLGTPSSFDGPPWAIVQFLSAGEDSSLAVDQLVEHCMEIKVCAEHISGAKTSLWLVFCGALTSGTDKIHPVAVGTWAFSRTLANEFPHLDVRRIDVAPGVTAGMASARIRDIILSGTKETELHINGTSIYTVRADTIRRITDVISDSGAEAARLQRRLVPGQRLHWQPVDRVTPRATEVEIAVEATGLNFRDLMWMLSLLPDDILEDGFAGPSLGLECAGTISRIGSSVEGFKPGDRVVTLTPSAFSTYVTVEARHIAKLPAQLSGEAAATIPVAFITAYYSLITQAKLKRGEWVLIHGGAGGVGMAAIQIAQSRNAKIIATAGSPAKRALLKALGVRHVLDSRSTNFVDGVRRITGTGVDVVLNSLANEAMEQSVACLRSFGRFVELGKRDYVMNTHLGLRPFRKNLSYFGVDIDQLIGRGETGRQVFAEVMRRFEKGTFTPLPYTVFDAVETAEAFQLMQQSAHIGKIVVRPPKPGTVRRANPPFTVNSRNTHLITGAFGGFGLEVAKWLVDNGARHLVLVGRRGPVSDEAKAAIEAFTARGIQLLVDRCDVADSDSLAKLFKKMRSMMPPLSGVIHSAMVLEDSIIANLDVDRLRRVLEPKVKGADNLDRLTRKSQLDYFVMFSSVTTLIGNPGQGNYVAANAYMEGLARRRRQEGLPALAIGWGPITDVGVVARSENLRVTLEKMTGARGMTAREALELMAQALGQNANMPELAVITIAPNDNTFGGDRLAVLRSPTYAALITSRRVDEGGTAKIDLRALTKTEDTEVVRRKVSDMIAAQLARVLHSREEDISRTRPLGEIGLDSLMALELSMNLEESFAIQVSLVGSAGEMTIARLTDEIIAQATNDSTPRDTVIAPIAQRHAETVEPEQIEALKELMSRNTHQTKRANS